MDSTATLQILAWIFQILTGMIALFAAIFAFSQIRSFKRFELLKYLQSDKFIEARRKVRVDFPKSIEEKPKEWWSDRDMEIAAATVATAYDIVGYILRADKIDRIIPGSTTAFFAKYWAASIVDNYEILLDYVLARRKKHGQDYYSGFVWLYAKAKRYRDKSRRSLIRTYHAAAD